MCVYLYKDNCCTVHTHILCRQGLLFSRRLVATNREAALVLIVLYNYNKIFVQKKYHLPSLLNVKFK